MHRRALFCSAHDNSVLPCDATNGKKSQQAAKDGCNTGHVPTLCRRVWGICGKSWCSLW